MGVWPEGKRCAVFLSFDYDTESAEVWRFPMGVDLARWWKERKA